MACDVPPCIGSVREQPTQPTPPGTNRPAGTPGVLAARAPVTAVRSAPERAPARGHPLAAGFETGCKNQEFATAVLTA